MLILVWFERSLHSAQVSGHKLSMTIKLMMSQAVEAHGFKSDTAVLTFAFLFLSSPLFSLFLSIFFFSCWAFSRLHFGGKFSGQCYMHGFLPFSAVSLTELCSFWYGLKDLFTLRKLAVTSCL